MLATIPAIIGVASTVFQTVQALLALKKDVGPAFAMLQKLFKKEGITVEELADIRARNDALNSELEGQTEAGQ